MLGKLILIMGVAAAASTTAMTTAWADKLPATLSAKAVIAAAPAGQKSGACSPGSPCAAVNCGPGRVCVPSHKQCFTTPCPQYDCVPASSAPRSNQRPPSLGSHPERWLPHRPGPRPAYPQQRQTADRPDRSPIALLVNPARDVGRVGDFQP